MFSRQYQKLNEWYSAHTHQERIIFLITAVLAILLLWYLIFAYPASKARAQYYVQIESIQKQIVAYQTTVKNIIKDAEKRAARQKLLNSNLKPQEKVELNISSSIENTNLFTAIFSPHTNINFLSRKTGPGSPTTAKVPGGKYSFQMVFQSSYFDTINYLDDMEKLPWCFFWDNLDYKVTAYPEANIVLNLHIVNT